MPREQKKRGRRAQKHQQKGHDGSSEPAAKRLRLDQATEHHANDVTVAGDAGDDFIGIQMAAEQQFYGLLDEEEQQYYANVNNKITADDFDSDADRQMFVEAVYRESKGKEIKLASSQSCSRYLEKLIQISEPNQLRNLFAAFLQDLDYLAQHRFGSHCCETLFRRTATLIERNEDTEGHESFEAMFLEAAKLLKKNLAFLLTERFASHTVRVLLLILSGDPLDDPSLKSIVASDKKETLDISVGNHAGRGQSGRYVPSTFRSALDELLATAASSMEFVYLRSLVTHPVGSPALQMMLRFELTSMDGSRQIGDKRLLKKLLPDLEFDVDSDTGKFLSGLVYDPTGSHLIETLVNYLPGKPFKKLYKNLYRDRIGKLAKNDIAGHVVIRVLERIGKDDLADARDKIVLEVAGLLQRHRFAVIGTLIERCEVRQVSLDVFVSAFKSTYEDSIVEIIPRLLQPQENSDDISPAKDTRNLDSGESKLERVDISGSRLIQSMLKAKSTCLLVQQSLIEQPSETLVAMARASVSSRVLQVALTSSYSDLKFRKQLITKLVGFIGELATNPAGSYVVDALWDGSRSSHFLKEKIAQELQQNETKLRESHCGRSVWRNWQMDVYQRRPREWHNKARGLTDQVEGEENNQVSKTPIQLARERHAKKGSKLSHQNDADNSRFISTRA